MKNLILSAGIVLATATGAFADSSILDVYQPEPVNPSAIDYAATAAIGTDYREMANPRLGDGAPVPGDYSVDYSATSAIGSSNAFELGPRLGDGDPN